MDNEMQNLTKRNLAIRIAEETGLTQQQVVAVIQKTLDAIVIRCAKDRRSSSANSASSTCASDASGSGGIPTSPIRSS